MTIKSYSTALVMTVLAGCAATTPTQPTGTAPVLQTDQQKSSYAQGIFYLQNLQKSEIPLDQDLFVLGMNDVLSKKPLRLNPAELQKGQDWVFVQGVLYNEKVSAENLAKGTAFLAENKLKPGVITTASGLQYKVLVPGKSTRKPTLKDTARVHFRITRLDGKELTTTEKSAKAPEVQIANLVKGWQEAMLLMTEGAKWRLFVPSGLAYGEAGTPDGRLGPNETLIYEVELLGLKASPTAKANATEVSASPTGDLKPTSSWKRP
ncbi:MAG: FKBP-type peptidyl-prolyl cis-trans isomerase N-terminal domain-containing protein [Methylococcaceae bacterium]